jgi:prepilin-type N-terminal cleavage/methylation domain-containing protein
VKSILNSRTYKPAFTIVELLIVIVVIGILAAITIVAYNGIQTRSQAASIISDLKATEKALNAYKIATGTTYWWVDSDAALAGTGNAPISSIITAQPTFRDFLQKAPTTTGLGASGGWFYDNDNDTYDGCSATLNGVNLAILTPTNTNLMQTIDNMMDDGNLSCGKVRYSGYLLYIIANNSTS